MTNETMTIEGNIKSLELNEVLQGFKFSNSIADILKWSLLGLYIKGDEEEINQLEDAFKKTGAYYEKRAYKTEAKAIFKCLKDNNEILVDKEIFTLESISKVMLENRPFSIGVVYKALPKAEKKTSVDSDLRKIVKVAIESPTIDTGEMKAKQLLDMANGVMGEELKPIAESKLEQAREEYTLAQAQAQATKSLNSIPAYNLEPEAFMETLKAMITQVHNFEGDLTPITDHIMELQTEPVAEQQAA